MMQQKKGLALKRDVVFLALNAGSNVIKMQIVVL